MGEAMMSCPARADGNSACWGGSISKVGSICTCLGCGATGHVNVFRCEENGTASRFIDCASCGALTYVKPDEQIELCPDCIDTMVPIDIVKVPTRVEGALMELRTLEVDGHAEGCLCHRHIELRKIAVGMIDLVPRYPPFIRPLYTFIPSDGGPLRYICPHLHDTESPCEWCAEVDPRKLALFSSNK